MHITIILLLPYVYNMCVYVCVYICKYVEMIMKWVIGWCSLIEFLLRKSLVFVLILYYVS